MTSRRQDTEFLEATVGDCLLEKAIEWIGKNMQPSEVFSESDLNDWAADNGFIQED
jgi:hypothetical protein